MCDKVVVSVWILTARTRDRLERGNVVPPGFKNNRRVGGTVVGSWCKSGLVVEAVPQELCADSCRARQ
jgi:hypothetical protein